MQREFEEQGVQCTFSALFSEMISLDITFDYGARCSLCQKCTIAVGIAWSPASTQI